MLYENELRRYDKWFRDKEGRVKVDYEFKGKVIENNIPKMVNELKKHLHFNKLFDDLGIYNANTLEDYNLQAYYNSLADMFGFSSIVESFRINNARYHRISRLRKRISNIIYCNKTSYFLTMTFTNDSLNNTDSFTRRRYVQRYLKSISNNYVANIDFGERNHREHYHAVVQCEYIDSKLWQHGSLNFEVINFVSTSSDDLLAKYITKLTFHAIKETTKRNHLIYSRSLKTFS